MVALLDDWLTRRVYKIQGQMLSIEEAGETIESRELIDPFQFASKHKRSGQPPHYRGLSSLLWSRGYFGYDTVRYVEPRLATVTPETITPDILLMLTEDVIVSITSPRQLITHVSDLPITDSSGGIEARRDVGLQSWPSAQASC